MDDPALLVNIARAEAGRLSEFPPADFSDGGEAGEKGRDGDHGILSGEAGFQGKMRSGFPASKVGALPHRAEQLRGVLPVHGDRVRRPSTPVTKEASFALSFSTDFFFRKGSIFERPGTIVSRAASGDSISSFPQKRQSAGTDAIKLSEAEEVVMVRPQRQQALRRHGSQSGRRPCSGRKWKKT